MKSRNSLRFLAAMAMPCVVSCAAVSDPNEEAAVEQFAGAEEKLAEPSSVSPLNISTDGKTVQCPDTQKHFAVCSKGLELESSNEIGARCWVTLVPLARNWAECISMV